MTFKDVMIIAGPMITVLLVVCAACLLSSRGDRRAQARLDAEYEIEEILHRRAVEWPEDGCAYCGSTDTPLDLIHRCTYCRELHRLTGPRLDPRFAPIHRQLIRG